MRNLLPAMALAFALFTAWLLQAHLGYSQTVLQVPYGKAAFHWDAPQDPPPAGVGVTRWYILNCGGADVRVDVPATSIAIKDVVSGPGSYSCTIKAVNTFGQSEPASFPAFEAGHVPANVENVRIEVRP